MPPLPEEAFTRLPEAQEFNRLLAVAACRYGAPSAAYVAAAPGTQLLLPMVAGLVPPGSARVLGPTYAEHARAAALAGHSVREVATSAELRGAALMVVVNPNNPDGRMLSHAELLDLAGDARRRGALLVVDEAFMDVGPEGAGLSGFVEQPGLVVLRSFGKFHGLAGVRLGFALAHPDVALHLRHLLGPWAISGPALATGLLALVDDVWAALMRTRLEREASRLDELLAAGGLTPLGGTTLFRLARGDPALFEHLGQRGIGVRRFAEQAGLLRFGLPADAAASDRLAAALATAQGSSGGA